MDGLMDGQMDGQTDRWTIWIDRQMARWTDGWMQACMSISRRWGGVERGGEGTEKEGKGGGKSSRQVKA